MARVVLSGSNCTRNGIFCWGWILDGTEYQVAIRRDYHGAPMLATRPAPEPTAKEEPEWKYAPLSPAYTCDGTWHSFRKNVAAFMEVQRAQRGPLV
jgi:hypothetical protein